MIYTADNLDRFLWDVKNIDLLTKLKCNKIKLKEFTMLIRTVGILR